MLKDIVSSIFILIVIYLLVNNAKGTDTVIGSIGNSVSQDVATLQGRSGVNNSVTLKLS